MEISESVVGGVFLESVYKECLWRFVGVFGKHL